MNGSWGVALIDYRLSKPHERAIVAYCGCWYLVNGGNMEMQKAKYGAYGEVTVSENGGALSKIKTQSEDEFWAPTNKLKFSKRQPVVIEIPAMPVAPEHGDVIAVAVAAVPTSTPVADKYVPAGYHKYKGAGDSIPAELSKWVSENCIQIIARVRVDDYERFAENLKDANGQEFTPLMDGFRFLGEKAWGMSLTIHLSNPVPAHFFDEIHGLQQRFGIRATSEPSRQTHAIYCNGLAWDLLRQGRKIGKATPCN